MAVTKIENYTTGGTPTISWSENQHHRNPSGLHNKVSWLLKESRRNPEELMTICKHKILLDECPVDINELISWKKAELLALICIRYRLSKPYEAEEKIHLSFKTKMFNEI